MNIFNRIVPWFIPTKDDQRKWYRDELQDTPKETARLLREFQELSEQYNRRLGDFEARLTKDYQLYDEYMEIKSLAQKVNFLWNRIEYKTQRDVELKKMLSELR